MAKVKIKKVSCSSCGTTYPLNIKAKIDSVSCPVCLSRIIVNEKLAVMLSTL